MSWLLKLLPSAKDAGPLLKKWGAGIAALAALGSYSLFIWNMAQNAQEAAYNAKLAEAAEDYKKDVDAAVAKAMATQQADFADEIERVRNNREVITQTEEVVKYVDRIKTVPAECTPVAIDVIRVLQQSTDLIRKAGSGEPDS